MTKLFGEYLIEKNLVTSDHVLTAVITQLRSTPSTAEIIFDNRLLPQKEQLRILAHQQLSGTDFRTSAAILGLWSDALAANVSAILRNKRRPIGEVLVELGYLTLEMLSQALDSYIEFAARTNQQQDKAKPEATAAASIQKAASIPAKSEDKLDSILTKEFVENFQTTISPSLNQVISQLESNATSSDSDKKLLKVALTEFTGLRAAAAFLNAKRSESIAIEMIASIELVFNKSHEIPRALLIDLIKTALHVMNSICQLLTDFHCEEYSQSDVNLSDLIDRLSKGHKRLRAQFSQTTQIS